MLSYQFFNTFPYPEVNMASASLNSQEIARLINEGIIYVQKVAYPLA